jgi:cysteine-rich repeat protein
VQSTYVAPEREWTHAAFVYDGPGSTATLYIDGQLRQQWAVAGPIGDVAAADQFEIGNRQNGTQPFHGAIDEVRVWNVARSAAEIAANWNRTLPDPQAEVGLVGYWMFDETGPVALDASGFERHGNLGYNDPARTPGRPFAPHLPGYELAYSTSCGDGFIDPLERCDDGASGGGDGCSATCHRETVFGLQGDPRGGTVSLVVEGVTIQITTSDGQTLDEVAAALAAAIEANPALVAMGVTATSAGSQVFIGGEYTDVVVADPGLMDCGSGLAFPWIDGPIVNSCPETTNPLSTDPGFAEYQWYYEGLPIPGADGPLHAATLTGDYTVRVGDGSGCTLESPAETTFVSFCPETEVSPAGAVFPLRLEKSVLSPTGLYAYFQSVDDVDGFNLYEGSLGAWYDHGLAAAPGCQIEPCGVPNDVGCYDGLGTGELRMAISPAEPDRYFLLSGYANGVEGPTGYDSTGTRRDPVQDTCPP